MSSKSFLQHPGYVLFPRVATVLPAPVSVAVTGYVSLITQITQEVDWERAGGRTATSAAVTGQAPAGDQQAEQAREATQLAKRQQANTVSSSRHLQEQQLGSSSLR